MGRKLQALGDSCQQDRVLVPHYPEGRSVPEDKHLHKAGRWEKSRWTPGNKNALWKTMQLEMSLTTLQHLQCRKKLTVWFSGNWLKAAEKKTHFHAVAQFSDSLSQGEDRLSDLGGRALTALSEHCCYRRSQGGTGSSRWGTSCQVMDRHGPLDTELAQMNPPYSRNLGKVVCLI